MVAAVQSPLPPKGNEMNLRKAIASVVLAGALTTGVTGVASAQTTPTSAPTDQHRVDCNHAHQVLARLHERIDDIKARIARVEARIDKLRQEGKNQRADVLSTRLESIKERLTKVDERLTKVEARVDKYCGTNPPAPAPAT